MIINVPKKYELGRPLLTWDKHKKVPTGVKRIHDWYMRASSVGIDTISVDIPAEAFNSDHTRAIRGHVVNDEPTKTRPVAHNCVCIVSVTHTML